MVSLSVGLHVEHDAARLAARFEGIPSRLDLALRDATGEGAEILARSEREVIPHRTGRTAATIASTMPRKTQAGWEADAGTNDEIARYLEEGTPPHRIEARFKRALFWEGARHPVRAVNHPGTRPYLWLEAAGEVGQPALQAAFERRIGEVFA